jgi:hypothetical protein
LKILRRNAFLRFSALLTKTAITFDIRIGNKPTDAIAATSTISASDVVAPPRGRDTYSTLTTIDIIAQNKMSNAEGTNISFPRNAHIINIVDITIITEMVVLVLLEVSMYYYLY